MSPPFLQWLSENSKLFTHLSYPTPAPKLTDSFHDSAHYLGGPPDVFFVITCIAVMAVLRDAFRLLVFEPFARWKLMRALRQELAKRGTAAAGNGRSKRPQTPNGQATIAPGANGNGPVQNGRSPNALANGHAKEHANGAAPAARPTKKQLNQVHRSVVRFAEQGWSVIYYTFAWTYGLYVHYNLPTKVLNPVDVWKNYPHTPLAGPVKFYYLVQTAFYLHQMLILQAEARRKDHAQMMAHHVITVGLLGLSYSMNLTRVGCLILLLMDWCDIFLPLAKMIRYLSISQLATDILFGWFMVSWLVTRHCLFLIVIWSVTWDAHDYIPPVYDPARGLYLTRPALAGFIAMLLALQVLQCIWFWMICRVAWRVVTGTGAEDERSDEECDGETRLKDD